MRSRDGWADVGRASWWLWWTQTAGSLLTLQVELRLSSDKHEVLRQDEAIWMFGSPRVLKAVLSWQPQANLLRGKPCGVPVPHPGVK